MTDLRLEQAIRKIVREELKPLKERLERAESEARNEWAFLNARVDNGLEGLGDLLVRLKNVELLAQEHSKRVTVLEAAPTHADRTRAIVQEEITRIDNEVLAEARWPAPAPPLEVSHSDSNPPRLIDRVAKLEQRLNAIERAATARMDRHADRLDALEQAKPIGTSVALPEDFDEAVAKALADGITKPRFGEPIAGRLDALEARLDSHANHLAANANDLDTLEGLLTKLAPRVDGQGTQLAGRGKRLGRSGRPTRPPPPLKIRSASWPTAPVKDVERDHGQPVRRHGITASASLAWPTRRRP